MPNVTLKCGEIQIDGGFEYRLLSDYLNQTNNPDCEQSWYLQDGRLIADPSDPQKLIYPVISVSSDHLVTSHCVNLNHEIICDSTDESQYIREIMFRVRNESTMTPNSDHFWWLLAVFIIALLIIILICLMKRKRIFR
ncbi:hypothetical protein ROHU_029195 [Labeo rohita]|uniref:Uncharacterized protein n=1 Tax=Labeo rohita TaxID=84645 RepID=A0A498LZR7_LABRO|nr:hypothetical protein ROHU_029195 [Labeo rohita]